MSKLGFHHSEETKEKIRQARLGTKMPPRTEEHRQNLSKAGKGKAKSEETKRKLSLARKGTPSSRKGACLSDETKKKIREANLGKKLSEDCKRKISEILKGRPTWNKGKRYSSPNNSLPMEKNPNWRGGISFELYSKDFTEDLKEAIRERDNYTCQECGIRESDLEGYLKKLDIHHIDYNKHHNKRDNLISLCRSCHAKTSFMRNEWTEYYRGKVQYE